MKCQYCGQPSTVHLTDIVKKKKREMHLCEDCAKKHNLIPESPSPQLNLQALVSLLMEDSTPEPSDDPSTLTCPTCGLKYAVFRADGRLGCPDDYEAFRPALEPLLERIHRHTQHDGKQPLRRRRVADLAQLRRQLTAAVAAERYEEAARLRDCIRQKETADEPG